MIKYTTHTDYNSNRIIYTIYYPFEKDNVLENKIIRYINQDIYYKKDILFNYNLNNWLFLDNYKTMNII